MEHIQPIISDHYLAAMIQMATPALLIIGLCMATARILLKINNKNNLKCKTKKHRKNLY